MEPAIEQANLDPPRPSRILSRGLPVAVIAHVLFAVALAWGVSWKRQSDATAALPLPDTTSAAPATSAMGSGPSPATSAAPAPSQPAAPTPQRPAAAAPAPNPAPQARPVPPPQRVAIVNPVRTTPAPAPAATRVQPSFDCARARSAPERLICADPELSRLDRELGRLYAQARAAAPNATTFRRQQDVEWRRREATCRDKACLLRWYAERRTQLETALAGSRQSAPVATRR